MAGRERQIARLEVVAVREDSLRYCTPRPRRLYLVGHEVDTAYQRGWTALRNGVLLKHAEQEGYDLLIATDRESRNRHKLISRTVSVVLIVPNQWPVIELQVAKIMSVVSTIGKGEFEEVRCW